MCVWFYVRKKIDFPARFECLKGIVKLERTNERMNERMDGLLIIMTHLFMKTDHKFFILPRPKSSLPVRGPLLLRTYVRTYEPCDSCRIMNYAFFTGLPVIPLKTLRRALRRDDKLMVGLISW